MRTKLNRKKHKGSYDKETLYELLDTTPFCNIAYIRDGYPYNLSTLQWREGNTIYWHGSVASPAIKHSINKEVCISVSRVDGLVLAKSAFEHTANFVSAMIFGKVSIVEDFDKKKEHLKNFTEALFPGRWEELRPMKDHEVKATSILYLSLDEFSLKIRKGPPADLEEDKTFPVWSGVLDISQKTSEPIGDEYSKNLQTPSYLKDLKIFNYG